jgi:hypothetical protein
MTRAAHARQRRPPDPFEEHVLREQDAASSRARVVAHGGTVVPIAMKCDDNMAALRLASLDRPARECFDELPLEASAEAILAWY